MLSIAKRWLEPVVATAWVPRALAVLGALVLVLLNLDAPLVEDSLFWWVPKALMAMESGPGTTYAHALPTSLQAGLTPQTTPPQWEGGLPDYAHPTLWYVWMGLFLSVSQTVQAVHLACLLPAVIAAVGFVEVGDRLGSRWAGLVPLMLPPIQAQLLRPELDLPLLAIVPWALLALMDGRWRHFAILGLLAPWMKEPGVLLVVPAVLRAARERQLKWEALTPLLGLALWGLAHGGLATPERMPVTPVQWLTRDLWVALRIVFIEQGRWLLLLALPWTVTRWRRGPSVQLAGALAAVWLLFFATVGFFATRGTADLHTHVRYFGPGLAIGAILLAVRLPWLALPGLLYLHIASPFGPEASRFGPDVGRAERSAAPWIRQAIDGGDTVWVGSYQAAGLTQPWAGHVDTPIQGFRIYAIDTRPEELHPGDLVVVSAYGEPAGRLERGLRWEPVQTWTDHAATVTAYRVLELRSPGALPPR